ncbi:MAG: protein kinase, partial [Myxococcota bacterium]|nr:protein kinase [Myxococcota bacterium]
MNERYRLDGVLGTGGMATVYRATDLLFSRTVALKLLAPEHLKKGNVLSRFQAEAHAMMRLHHPNVVEVDDYGAGSQPFIAMEFVSGGSVQALLDRNTSLDFERAFDIIDGVLSGLINIHASGLVHRDIKPANILLTDTGTPKLTDFGIARASERAAFQTRTGAVMGTPAFMAPEQRTSATLVTEASDLYSVGATLYVLLTGRPPQNLYVREQQNDAFRDLPEALRIFLEKACSFTASERYSNASEMQAALRVVRRSQSATRVKPVHPSAMQMRGNLPLSRGPFVGRTDELEHMSAWAESADARVLSVVGLGGIGKSRLALEFGHRQSDRWTGGIWRIDASAVRVESDLQRALGAALGLYLDSNEPLTEIARHLNSRNGCLIIFDNAEEARAVLAPSIVGLLERVPALRVLVTTREEFNARWERILSVGELDLRASVALLMQTAGRTIDLTGEPHADTEAFEAIARLLEGHPLSLELAATQLELLAPAQLYRRLVQSVNTDAHSVGPTLMGILDTAMRGSQAQSSVQASLAWSWSLLTEAERAVLAQCALFVSGFDVEAAEAVVRLAEPNAPPLMGLLQSLRSRNLLRIRTPFAACRRLSVPRLVRSFALAHGQRDELDEAQLRMAQHFSAMGTEAQIFQRKSSGVLHRRIAKLEVPNIQHCFEWAMNHHHAELSAMLSLAALALLKTTGPFDGVTEMLRRANLALDEGAPLKPRVLLQQCRLAMNREGLDVAEPLVRRCIELADASGMADISTQSRVALAFILSRTNRLALGLTVAETAVRIATEADDQHHLPRALYCRGYLTQKAGEPRAASTDLFAALRGFQRMGHRVSEGKCLGDLGEYHHYVGETTRAKQCYEQAQAIAHEQGDKSSAVRGHRRMAWLHMDAGDWAQAEESIRSGLRVARELGDLPGEASLVGTLGTVAASSGNYEQALIQLQEADRMYELQGNTEQRHNCRVNMCISLEQLNRLDEALAMVDELKGEPELVPMTKHFVTLVEMKLHIRRNDWHAALALSDDVLDKLEALQAWDRTISVHAYNAICAAALGDDPAPHFT